MLIMDAIQQPALSPSRERGQIGMFLLFLLLALIFYFDFFLGPYAIFRLHDTFDFGFIEYLIRGKLFLNYGLFAWDSHYAGGMPSFAGHFTPYFPLSLISSVLPPWLIFSLMAVGLTTLAGYGMYRLLAGFFQVPRPLAVFGGAVFAISTTTISVQIVFCYVFPLFFMWSMDLGQRRLGRLGKTLRVLGLVALALVSYPVLTLPFFPIFHLALVLAFGRNSPNFKGLIWVTLMVWTGYVLLFAPLLYTLLEYVPFAQRTYDFEYQGLLAALGSFGVLSRDCFLDESTFLLILCGLSLVRPSRRLALALALVMSFIPISAFFNSQFNCLLSESSLVKMDLGHFNLLVPAGAVIAATLLLEEMRRAPFSFPRLFMAALIFALIFWCYHPVMGTAVLVMGLSLLALMRLPVSLRNSAVPAPFWGKLAVAAFAAGLASLGMLAKQSNGNFAYNPPYARNYGNHPELQRIAKERNAEVFRVGTVDVHPSVAQSYGLETVGQRGPLFNKYYKQFFRAVVLPQLGDPEVKERFDHYWYDLYLGLTTPANQASRFKLLRSAAEWNLPLLLMLNVKYLISDKPIKGIEAFADLYCQSQGQGLPVKFLQDTRLQRGFTYPLWIYRFRQPFTRGYLAQKPVVLADHQEVLKQLAQQTEADLREKVFFARVDFPAPAGPPAAPTCSGSLGETLRLLEYSPDRLIFEGSVSSPGFLVVTQNYDPKWVAVVNHQKVPLYRANYAFQAVPLSQAGPFRAVLEYRDPQVWWLHLVSLAGLGLLLACAFLGPGAPDATPRAPLDNLPQDGASPEFIPAATPSIMQSLGNRWLMALSGGAAAVVIVGYSVCLKKLPGGVNVLYFLTVMPGVGILLSLWASFMARLCWRKD